MRPIDADAFIKELKDLYFQENWEKRDIHFSLADIICNIEYMPTIDIESEQKVVPAYLYDVINKRLQHLLQSRYISSFDRVYAFTGDYVRDIRDADKENYKYLNEKGKNNE